MTSNKNVIRMRKKFSKIKELQTLGRLEDLVSDGYCNGDAWKEDLGNYCNDESTFYGDGFKQDSYSSTLISTFK